jgi:hypothetical protein
MKDKQKYTLIGIVSSIGFFFLFSIPTALFPNNFFIRMIPSTTLDYVFLIFSSILLGAYVGVHLYKKKNTKACNRVTTAGGIGGFLAFGCPICNKLFVLLFGATALMTYLEPYRPILGFVSTGLMGGALWWRIKHG